MLKYYLSKVTNWNRKATPSGFHFLPAPKDPFALPFSTNSDPLRGPIFVSLNIECLRESNQELFEGKLLWISYKHFITIKIELSKMVTQLVIIISIPFKKNYFVEHVSEFTIVFVFVIKENLKWIRHFY